MYCVQIGYCQGYIYSKTVFLTPGFLFLLSLIPASPPGLPLFDSPASLCPVLLLSSNSMHSGSSALPSNMAYFGSSQEEDDLEEENEEDEEEFRTGSGTHSHGAGSSSQASTSSSCHSTPCKGKLPARQPLNGHGKDRTTGQELRTKHAAFLLLTRLSCFHTIDKGCFSVGVEILAVFTV